MITSIEKIQYNYAGGAEYLKNKWQVVELANNEFYYFSTIQFSTVQALNNNHEIILLGAKSHEDEEGLGSRAWIFDIYTNEFKLLTCLEQIKYEYIKNYRDRESMILPSVNMVLLNDENDIDRA